MKIAMSTEDGSEQYTNDARPLRYFEFRGHKFAVHHPGSYSPKGLYVVTHYATGRFVYDGPCRTISQAIDGAIEKMSEVPEDRFHRVINKFEAINK